MTRFSTAELMAEFWHMRYEAQTAPKGAYMRNLERAVRIKRFAECDHEPPQLTLWESNKAAIELELSIGLRGEPREVDTNNSYTTRAEPYLIEAMRLARVHVQPILDLGEIEAYPPMEPPILRYRDQPTGGRRFRACNCEVCHEPLDNPIRPIWIAGPCRDGSHNCAGIARA